MLRILVAEDDEGMRALIKRVIARVLPKYDLALVSSYDEAIALIKNSRDGWDVAVLDGSIPLRGEGQLLAGFLRQSFPGIKIVSCSSSNQSWGDKNIHKRDLETKLPVVIEELLSPS